MPLIQRGSVPIFDPDQITAMHTAFERVCARMRLSGTKAAPIIELVAIKIVELASAGEFDPEKLTCAVIAEFCRYRLREYLGIWALVWRLLIVLTMVFLGHAALDTWGQPNRFFIYSLTFERDVNIASVIILLLLLLIRNYYGLSLEPLQRQIAVGLLLFLVGGVGAYGWVGDRSITRWAPDSRLYVLLAAGVGMICAFCAVLLLGGLDPKALLGTKERIWWIMGGGLGEILALAWILVGLHRLRKQGRKLLPTIRRVV